MCKRTENLVFYAVKIVGLLALVGVLVRRHQFGSEFNGTDTVLIAVGVIFGVTNVAWRAIRLFMRRGGYNSVSGAFR